MRQRPQGSRGGLKIRSAMADIDQTEDLFEVGVGRSFVRIEKTPNVGYSSSGMLGQEVWP